MDQRGLPKQQWLRGPRVLAHSGHHTSRTPTIWTMRIRSLTELNEFLNDELAWRKRELTTLRFLIGRSRPHEQDVLLRSGTCTLYAHWEGFVKAAATGYVSYVTLRGLSYRDLSPNFVALGLRTRIVNAGTTRRPSQLTAITAALMSDLAETARIDWDTAIDTRANLNSDAFREILVSIGLEEARYSTKGALIDQRLLRNRNVISHGGYLSIQLEDYNELHTEVVQMVEWFRNDVENAAVTAAYRRV